YSGRQYLAAQGERPGAAGLLDAKRRCGERTAGEEIEPAMPGDGEIGGRARVHAGYVLAVERRGDGSRIHHPGRTHWSLRTVVAPASTASILVASAVAAAAAMFVANVDNWLAGSVAATLS